MSRTMLFNPYTGHPRDPRDIASDPEGVLMVDPDEPLRAAPAVTPGAPDPCDSRCTWADHAPECPRHDSQEGNR